MPVKHIYQVEKSNNKYKNFYFAIFLDTHSSTFKTQALHVCTCNFFFFNYCREIRQGIHPNKNAPPEQSSHKNEPSGVTGSCDR